MRTEVKAGIVIGLVLVAGAIIWSVSGSGKGGDDENTIPLDVAKRDMVSPGNLGLAGDQTRSSAPLSDRRASPTPVRPSGARRGGGSATPTRTTRPPLQPTPTAAEQRSTTPTIPPSSPSATTQPARPRGTTPRSANAGGRQPTGTGTPPAGGVQVPPRKDSTAEKPTAKKPDPRERPGGLADRMRDLKKPADKSKSYTIKLGDNFTSIARAHYGDGKYWELIQKANPGVDPNRLQVGQVITLPPKDSGTTGTRDRKSDQPSPAGRATYIVAEGDSLTSIARNVLKDENRWREIFELNKDKLASPNLIKPGMELKMPPLEAPRGSDDK